jgi:hypothetical protein
VVDSPIVTLPGFPTIVTSVTLVPLVASAVPVISMLHSDVRISDIGNYSCWVIDIEAAVIDRLVGQRVGGTDVAGPAHPDCINMRHPSVAGTREVPVIDVGF